MTKIAKNEKLNEILVPNWKSGWKWLSTWMFALIIFITTVPLPPEALEALPEPMRLKVLGVLAIIGFIMRFVQQSKPKT